MQLEYRMYGLVPYNLSPIQQGIQFGHGVVEYMRTYYPAPPCDSWADNDKTFIILNGGTTNDKYTLTDKNTYVDGFSVRSKWEVVETPMKLNDPLIYKTWIDNQL